MTIRSIVAGLLLFAGHSWFSWAVAADPRSIVVAQIVPLSGPVGVPGSQFAAGAALYFDHVNANGGVGGRMIEHLKLDDRYDVNESLVQWRRLGLRNDYPRVLMTFGTASSMAIAQEMDSRNIQLPVFPTGSGATSLRVPFNRNLFHVRASYAREFASLIQLLATTGITRFSVVYQDDAFGRDGLDAIRQKLAELKLSPAAEFKHARNAEDISGLVAPLSEVDSQVVLLASTPGPVASFVKAARSSRLNKQIATVSDTDPYGLVEAVGVDAARGVMFSQSLPNLQSASVPLVVQFARLARAKGAAVPINAATLEGYIQARVIVEVLRRAPNATGIALIEQFEALRELDLGGYHIRFSKQSHEGASRVDTAIISDAGQVRR